MQQTLDAIHSLDIVKQIEKYVKLKKEGQNYKGYSPFSQEKTPSFVVNPRKNNFYDYSSNIGGDLITFIQEHDKLTFLEAVKKICTNNCIQFQIKEYTPEQVQEQKHRQSLTIACNFVADYFNQQLFAEENAVALEYALSRIPLDLIEKFNIGWAADDWHNLEKHATSKGYKKDNLIAAGVITENDKKQTYDTYRHRLMFPITDHMGKTIAFGGRYTGTDKKIPKYINSQETPVYKKEYTLYGIYEAKSAIREKNGVYIVEGYMDVIAMHRIGKKNTVGTCGTALTPGHISELKKLTTNVVVLTDGDDAGRKAMHRSAEMFIKAGMNCNVIPLPWDGKNKTDPDSFFLSGTHFDEYKKQNQQNYLLYLAKELYPNIKNFADRKTSAIEKLCQLIICYENQSLHEVFIDELSKIITPKKLWTDTIKALKKETVPNEKEWKVPKHVSLDDFEKYGFYVENNSYHFRNDKGTIIVGSNFCLTPLFHVESVLNAKRLFEIKNEFGYTRVIELAQKDLISLSNFKLRVESLGNFIWYAPEMALNRLKGYLYEKTETCIEITQLGWNKRGMWCWANGIFNGQFTKVDEYGIASHNKKNYYMPAFSKVYEQEDTLFVSERKFIHTDGHLSINEYLTQMITVFGDNAKVAFSFYLATLFRDYLIQKFNFFPILNIFGPKGTGKTELALCIMQFFGKMPKGPNIQNTTKAALADHVSQTANACSHIDEYKNYIDIEKIEFLKGLWDGTGRTRMNMDKDKKKEITAVDCGVILTGQEMPTSDIALFSRLIFLCFTKTEFTKEAEANFKTLKNMYKKGMTHITESLLKYRADFIKDYDLNHKEAADELQKKLSKQSIEGRIFNNWIMILASFKTIGNYITLPFSYTDLLGKATNLIQIQNSETKKSNELSIFWQMVSYLNSEGFIQEGVDFKIEGEMKLKTDKIDAKFSTIKHILYVDLTKIVPLYRKHGAQQKENILPVKTLEYYLTNDALYLGRKSSVRFRRTVPGTNSIQADKYKVTRALTFDYDKLSVDITLKYNEETVEDKLLNDKNIDSPF
jgi:DNA primase catalytic core